MAMKSLQGKGAYHFKNGDLDSDPLTRVHSGWLDAAGGKAVVVMVTQPTPGSLPRDKAGERLEKTAQQITEAIFDLTDFHPKHFRPGGL